MAQKEQATYQTPVAAKTAQKPFENATHVCLTKRRLSGVTTGSCLVNYLNAPPTITEKIANQVAWNAVTSQSVRYHAWNLRNAAQSNPSSAEVSFDSMSLDLQTQARLGYYGP